MPARTYVPTLRYQVQVLYRYVTRWLQFLQRGLTVEQATALATLLAALEALIQALGPEPEEL